MFGGDNGNTVFPTFLEDNRVQCDCNAVNASTQLQLFGNFPAGYSVDPVSCVGNEHVTAMNRPAKQGREAEDILRQQSFQMSLKTNFCQHEANQSPSFPNPIPVSTGLRLSYDDDERNSAVTFASGSIASALPVILSLGDNLRTEIDRQRKEFDHYIRVQEEHLIKGVWEMNQRHMASFLSSIEKRVCRKLCEKELEIENLNRKNRELVERIKHVAMEVQSWHYRAKYNELVVNVLKNNLKQAIAQGVDQAKEGCGDSGVDDAASSYIDYNNRLCVLGGHVNPVSGNKGLKEQMTCKACKCKEVSILLWPCRHLCLCKDCEGFINVCPVCQSMKTLSIQVYMS
ncbi:E3 ubiquitin-protein ligase BOI-like [Macadamia integrifolia]|uniref:E3 ubiquitin-protein ligase BOI-like n=1 Tax=Macadamia integrifolia TaxID=60698 RepID=UPI001C4E5137|nr:E3 ubiquitin-protein ligase BOI-like [Macadamia integrifolia]XP_042500499.1 E3 ubiquitin-protein ligase BOI-like [Macadamia integrifolia]